jgi:hypothetical protein
VPTNNGVGKTAVSSELLRGEYLTTEEVPDATQFSKHFVFADRPIR